MQIRYVHKETGAIFPDTIADEYACPPELRREANHVQEDGSEDWRELPNKPMPGVELQARGVVEDQDGYVPDYDTPISAWASNTTGGGPSNFHGNAGGDANPRDRAAEGQVDGDFEAAALAYQSSLPSA